MLLDPARWWLHRTARLWDRLPKRGQSRHVASGRQKDSPGSSLFSQRDQPGPAIQSLSFRYAVVIGPLTQVAELRFQTQCVMKAD
ncbi:Uncharacterised protein [Vibrio cholerae]|nr:Uncharacterised protein [Vibrio cholerae]